DSTTGTITACYPTSGATKGALRVIDYQGGARCGSGEAMLTWRQGSNCDSFPHAGIDWHACDFHYANVSGQNLTGANLGAVNLSGSQARNVRFNNANLI